MSEVQIVYLTVSQIYLIESLAEQEVERLQDEMIMTCLKERNTPYKKSWKNWKRQGVLFISLIIIVICIVLPIL